MYGSEVCDGGRGAGGQNCTVERSVTEEGCLGPELYGKEVCDGGRGAGGQNSTVERSLMEEGVLGAKIVR